MTAPLLVLDRVLEGIECDIGAHVPERGGALFGPAEGPLVVGFLHDRWAATTSASYHASRSAADGSTEDESLEGAIRLVEDATPLRYRGTVHSHPARLDRPSEQDLVAFEDSLRRNPWLTDFLGPIVTQRRQERLAPHEVAIPSGKVSWFSAVRDRSTGRVELVRPRVRVLRLGEELDRLAAGGWFDVDDWQLSHANGEPVLVATLRPQEGDEELTVRVWPGAHPLLPPLVTRSRPGQEPEPVTVTWDHAVSAADRLAWVGEELGAGARRNGTADRPPPPVPATAPPVGQVVTGEPASAELVRAGLQARLRGMVPDGLRRRRILIAGAGSIGSQLAEALVRSGVEDLVVIDPESVGPENLSRTVYVAADVGQPKVVALPRRLQAINPAVRVAVHPGDLGDVDRSMLQRIVAGCDLVVAATDDVRAQAVLDRLSYASGVPAVFPGMYAGGRGGEVVFTVPGLSSCYRCATAIRHSQDETVRPAADYGLGGRLTGEVALGTDIAHVTTAATKIALALLELGEGREGTLMSEFLLPGMAQGRTRPATMVLFANVPGYSFFPSVFDGVAGQAAWQSVWLEVVGDPTCATCGRGADGPEPDDTDAVTSARLVPPPVRIPHRV